MKIKIVKKMLSILLIASGLATTPFAVSAANDGLGDSKPANCGKNSQNELENDIKELDEVIADLKEKIKDYESDRDRKTKEIDEKIKHYSKELDNFEKKLHLISPRKKFRILKNKNSLQIIDRKLKLITKRLNSSCQHDDQLKKQFEVLKNKIEELLEERESVENEFQESTQIEREELGKLLKERESVERKYQDYLKTLQECVSNRNAKVELDNKILEEKKPLDEKVSKDLKSKAHKLSQLSSDLLGKYLMLAEEHKVTLANDHKTNLMNLQSKVAALLSKDELDQNDRDEYNGMVDTYRILKQEVKELESQIESKIESQRLLEQEKIKSKNTFEQQSGKNASEKQLLNKLNELVNNMKKRKLSKQNQIKNSKHQPKESAQARQERELWQKINSGSQCCRLNRVNRNLCWLHSATNVLNYYNNMKNQGIINGQRQTVQEYKQIMDEQAGANNINGTMQGFEQISEYLEKFSLGLLKMTISTESNEKKLMDTVKDLLKIHFVESPNPSPVIIHQPNHFITIAGYDQNEDQFLIVDSMNLDLNSSDATVEWRPAQNTFHPENLGSTQQTITMGFTSSSMPCSQSIDLYINKNNSVMVRSLQDKNDQQILINDLKNMIKNY